MKTLKVIGVAILTMILGAIATLLLLPKKATLAILNKDKDLADKINEVKERINNYNNQKDNVDEDWYKE